ncbi:TetR/AcrR family transcriptional regulator [Falsibacillus pallidus]|uniref:TetR family transcriptional regulator n=1 Tax=Falsibacillus pallidus TaxID=493781 RepID=A0A370GF53_9BACI|nr:TetR/AcrR family transcriptional regulator [Falsibacillus pallidus]RDI41910.1 TetR family transcriptional regulator [Falsibacillus pallidus]
MDSKDKRNFEKGEHVETRNAIIKTAHDLFMEYGYRSVSTRQIADLCGLTQPALYHHFTNKKELYIEVIRETIFKTQTAVQRILKRPQSLRERLQQYAYYMMLNHHEDLNQMFHDIEHQLDAASQAQIYQWWMNGYLMPVVAVFEEAAKEGKLQNQYRFGATPIDAAHFLLSLIKSSMEPSKFLKDSSKSRQEAAEEKSHMIVDVLLYGLS